MELSAQDWRLTICGEGADLLASGPCTGRAMGMPAAGTFRLRQPGICPYNPSEKPLLVRVSGKQCRHCMVPGGGDLECRLRGMCEALG
jgi:hypothetical protein